MYLFIFIYFYFPSLPFPSLPFPSLSFHFILFHLFIYKSLKSKLAMPITMRHKFLAGVYFRGMANLCVLQELLFAIGRDCFFLLRINFCDFQRVEFKWINNILKQYGHIKQITVIITKIKIRVYGKRERQKLPRDHDFPAIFHVCRLPFAVFNAKRTVFAFGNNVSIYHKFLIFLPHLPAYV